MGANWGGRGSTREFEKDKQCRKCHKRGVYYVGSTVTHGNPYTPASDTEVEHYYECPHCGKEFDVYV
ncbi:MAG: hypothetical protein KC731_06640 [Myxococcales bacterium]|nr:hypothetical protein [Myxococcales bacterium]MCB9755985.1 hypothetical protein [Myxococcales bacterium]